MASRVRLELSTLPKGAATAAPCPLPSPPPSPAAGIEPFGSLLGLSFFPFPSSSPEASSPCLKDKVGTRVCVVYVQQFTRTKHQGMQRAKCSTSREPISGAGVLEESEASARTTRHRTKSRNVTNGRQQQQQRVAKHNTARGACQHKLRTHTSTSKPTRSHEKPSSKKTKWQSKARQLRVQCGLATCTVHTSIWHTKKKKKPRRTTFRCLCATLCLEQPIQHCQQHTARSKTASLTERSIQVSKHRMCKYTK